MKISNDDLIRLHNTLKTVSLERHPFAIKLAKNIKMSEKLLLMYEDSKHTLIDKHAKRDEEGKLLGVIIPAQAVPGEPETAPQPVKRVTDPKRIDQIEWNDKEGFLTEFTALNNEQVDLEFDKVDVNTVFYNARVNRDMTIKDDLDVNMTSDTLLHLYENGFFDNLEI